MFPIVILLLIGAVALVGGASWVVFGLMMWAGLWLLFASPLAP